MPDGQATYVALPNGSYVEIPANASPEKLAQLKEKLSTVDIGGQRVNLFTGKGGIEAAQAQAKPPKMKGPADDWATLTQEAQGMTGGSALVGPPMPTGMTTADATKHLLDVEKSYGKNLAELYGTSIAGPAAEDIATGLGRIPMLKNAATDVRAAANLPFVNKYMRSIEGAPTMMRSALRGMVGGAGAGAFEGSFHREPMKGALYGAGAGAILGAGLHLVNRMAGPDLEAIGENMNRGYRPMTGPGLRDTPVSEAQKAAFQDKGYTPQMSADTSMHPSTVAGGRPTLTEQNLTEIIKKPIRTPEEDQILTQAFGDQATRKAGEGLVAWQGRLLGYTRGMRATTQMADVESGLSGPTSESFSGKRPGTKLVFQDHAEPLSEPAKLRYTDVEAQGAQGSAASADVPKVTDQPGEHQLSQAQSRKMVKQNARIHKAGAQGG